MSILRLALIQMLPVISKGKSLKKAMSFIDKAKQNGADLVVLPELFTKKYGNGGIEANAENIPTGESCEELSKAARRNEVYVIGGTIFEQDGDKIFNTSTVWSPQGELIAKYRKIHLIDLDIKGKITFYESQNVSPGNQLATFKVKGWKIGLGVCHDLRFEELAKLYRAEGCHLLVYPGAFNTVTGPIHWQLLGRSRANDNQLYVACVSPAAHFDPVFSVYGHSQLINPWGEVLAELGSNEGTIIKDIDMKVVEELRAQLPVFNQRRTDIYDTIRCRIPARKIQY